MISNPGLKPFVDFASKAGQSFFNWVLTDLPKALDGVDGGSYSPLNLLTIAGSGLAGIIGGTLSFGANGRFTVRVDTTSLGDSATTFRNSDLAEIYFADVNLTGVHNWDIDDTSAEEGELCLVACRNVGSGRGVIRSSSGPTTICLLPVTPTTGLATVSWVLLRMGASEWEAVAAHPDCTI